MMSRNKSFPFSRADNHFCGFHKIDFRKQCYVSLYATLWKTLVQTLKIGRYFSEPNLFISKVCVCKHTLEAFLKFLLTSYKPVETSQSNCFCLCVYALSSVSKNAFLSRFTTFYCFPFFGEEGSYRVTRSYKNNTEKSYLLFIQFPQLAASYISIKHY